MLLLQAPITKYMPNQLMKEDKGEERVAPKRGRPKKAIGAEADAATAPKSGRGRGRGAARKGKQATAPGASHNDAVSDGDAPTSSAAAEPAGQAAVSAAVRLIPCHLACLLHVSLLLREGAYNSAIDFDNLCFYRSLTDLCQK